ncbi:hypothetical protein NE865_00794 [Phthorimaea operculella]|nr:hypothetical protein NE865_00794 [Phthorimaea operculella]
MSANKENVKASERRKSAMKRNKEDSPCRNPLKTLSFYPYAENCLAGPSQGPSVPKDTRYVTYRNQYERLDWGYVVFKDDPKQPEINKNKDTEKKTESEKQRRYEVRAEKELSKTDKKTEKPSSYKDKNPENYPFNIGFSIPQTKGEKKAADCIQGKDDLMSENYQRSKKQKTENDQHNKETKTDKANTVKTETTNSNDDNARLRPIVSIVIRNSPLVVIKTPHVEIYPTKKVKHSLKRPQTRLLATASPVSAKSCHFSIYSNNDILAPNLSAGKSFDPLNNPYMMDNLNYLLQTEKKVLGEPRIRRASRSCVINWIINVNGSGGNPAVVQLAAWYFDCYLCTAWVSINRLQVIAAACFWIATKFHGRLVSGKRLVKYSGHAFIEKELVDSERNILKRLRFQALPVVPQDFVPYLAWICDDTNSGLVEAAAVFLCQCGVMTDKTLSEEYPSVVAAAAVKDALILMRMESCYAKLGACPVFKAAVKKAVNLDATCAQLRDAVRVVASEGYEYKAPLFKYSAPPHYISSNIVRAVNHKDVVLMDIKERRVKKSI